MKILYVQHDSYFSFHILPGFPGISCRSYPYSFINNYIIFGKPSATADQIFSITIYLYRYCSAIGHEVKYPVWNGVLRLAVVICMLPALCFTFAFNDDYSMTTILPVIIVNIK